jgi:thymidine kinase
MHYICFIKEGVQGGRSPPLYAMSSHLPSVPFPGLLKGRQTSAPDASYVSSAPPTGFLKAIIGPMFAGKTTRLLEEIDKDLIRGHNVVLIGYAEDTRYDKAQHMSTHCGRSVHCLPLTRLKDLPGTYLFGEEPVYAIAINELQFFPDAVEEIGAWRARGLNVYFSALNLTTELKPWSVVQSLLCYATDIIKLHSICSLCPGRGEYPKLRAAVQDSDMTACTDPLDESSVKVIGGSEMYMVCCAACIHLSNDSSKSKETLLPFQFYAHSQPLYFS